MNCKTESSVITERVTKLILTAHNASDEILLSFTTEFFLKDTDDNDELLVNHSGKSITWKSD